MSLQSQARVWENQRWSTRKWAFNDSVIPKIDPPPFSDDFGEPASLDQIDQRMRVSKTPRQPIAETLAASHRHSTATPGADEHSGVNAGIFHQERWEWVPDSEWEAGAWTYSFSFQGQWKPKKDNTTFVRRRLHQRKMVRLAPTGRKASGIRFSEDTVLKREMPNSVWKWTVASRNAPRLIAKYRTDCVQFKINEAVGLAALIASSGTTTYLRQTNARELLAGKVEWPDTRACEIVRNMPSGTESMDAIWSECYDQLIEDVAQDGLDAACEEALQRIAMISVNYNNRKTQLAAAAGEADGADGDAAGASASASGPEPVTPTVDVSKMLEFIETSIGILEDQREVEMAASDGYDTSDGWCVLDDDAKDFKRPVVVAPAPVLAAEAPVPVQQAMPAAPAQAPAPAQARSGTRAHTPNRAPAVPLQDIDLEFDDPMSSNLMPTPPPPSPIKHNNAGATNATPAPRMPSLAEAGAPDGAAVAPTGSQPDGGEAGAPDGSLQESVYYDADQGDGAGDIDTPGTAGAGGSEDAAGQGVADAREDAVAAAACDGSTQDVVALVGAMDSLGQGSDTSSDPAEDRQLSEREKIELEIETLKAIRAANATD